MGCKPGVNCSEYRNVDSAVIKEILELGLTEPSINLVINSYSKMLNKEPMIVLKEHLLEVMLDILKVEIKLRQEYYMRAIENISNSNKPIVINENLR